MKSNGYFFKLDKMAKKKFFIHTNNLKNIFDVTYDNIRHFSKLENSGLAFRYNPPKNCGENFLKENKKHEDYWIGIKRNLVKEIEESFEILKRWMVK